MDKGAWQATVHGVTQQSDMTYRLNNKPNNSQKQYKWKERKKERNRKKKGRKKKRESKQASKIETSLIGNYEMQ